MKPGPLRFPAGPYSVGQLNSFLYGVTDLFLAPFASLAGAPSAGGMVLEISTILAMIVYVLLAWGLERIVYVIFYRPRGAVSVRQTVVSDHIPPTSVDVTETSTTTHTPSGVSQTAVTEHTTP